MTILHNIFIRFRKYGAKECVVPHLVVSVNSQHNYNSYWYPSDSFPTKRFVRLFIT